MTTERLSAFIDGQRPELLERWIAKLRQNATGEELPREDLEDRFRSYLRKLVEALERDGLVVLRAGSGPAIEVGLPD